MLLNTRYFYFLFFLNRIALMNAQSPITWLGFVILVSIAIFPYFVAKW